MVSTGSAAFQTSCYIAWCPSCRCRRPGAQVCSRRGGLISGPLRHTSASTTRTLWMTASWRNSGTACCSCATELLPWIKPGSLCTMLLIGPCVMSGFVMPSCTMFVSFMFLDLSFWIAQPCFLHSTSEQSGSDITCWDMGSLGHWTVTAQCLSI